MGFPPVQSVLNTIISLFAVIVLGWWTRSRGLLPENVVSPLNRLVFYLAIPAMLFREIAGASFHAYFDPLLVLGTLLPPVIVFFAALGVGRLFRLTPERWGTFVQTSIHGNLGYMGLAVAFYALGKEGFARAGLLASFLILAQNFLAIVALQSLAGDTEKRWNLIFFLKTLLANPIVLTSLGAIAFSLAGLHLPGVVDRTLKILSGMALPLALLLIGASLSLSPSMGGISLVGAVSFLKLVLQPALGWMLFGLFDLDGACILPGIILLASPTATLSYVLAGEMGGDPSLASTAISVTTPVSGLTFVGWLVLLR